MKKLHVLRAQRTKLTNRVNDDIDIADQHVQCTPANRVLLQQLRLRLEARSAEIRALNELILSHPDLSETDETLEIEEADERAVSVLNCITRLQIMLAERPNEPPPLVAGDDSSPKPVPTAPQVLMAAPPVLDTMPERFSGHPLRYRAWRTRFDHWINQEQRPLTQIASSPC